MDGTARFIFPVVIAAIIVFIVSGVVTYFNIGLRTDFVPRWLSAFIVGWPVASVTAFAALPFARAGTLRIVGMIDRTSAANPKFARFRGKTVANFGFKSGTRIMKLLVPPRFRSSHQRSPHGFANFGIGTLA